MLINERPFLVTTLRQLETFYTIYVQIMMSLKDGNFNIINFLRHARRSGVTRDKLWKNLWLIAFVMLTLWLLLH